MSATDSAPAIPESEKGPESVTIEICANQRWLRKRRKELLAALSRPYTNELLQTSDAQWIALAAQTARYMQLQAIEGAIQAMSTPEGAAEFKKSSRAAKKVRQTERITVAVYGEVTRGKSSFLNATLGSGAGESEPKTATPAQNSIEIRATKQIGRA